VSPDDLVVSEKLKGVDVNDRLALGRVLMLGSRSETVVGRPHIPGASVNAVVEARCHPMTILLFQALVGGRSRSSVTRPPCVWPWCAASRQTGLHAAVSWNGTGCCSLVENQVYHRNGKAGTALALAQGLSCLAHRDCAVSRGAAPCRGRPADARGCEVPRRSSSRTPR